MKSTLQKRATLILVAALSVSFTSVLQVQAALFFINVSNVVNGTPPPDDWNYMIKDINTPVVAYLTLPAAGGGNFQMNYAEPMRVFSITQGGVTTPVEPIHGDTSAVDFYGYNETERSGHAPYMEYGKSKIYLYEDTSTGALSLIIHHNVHLGPINYIMNMSLQGLPVGTDLTLSDDPGDFGPRGGGVALGYWDDGNSSDGCILSGLQSTDWAITAQMLYHSPGIVAWEYQAASGPITLDMTEPLTISAETLVTREFLIAQHQKLGYDTSIIVNGTVVPTITENLMDTTLVSLAPDDTISVEFRNAEIPKEALVKQATATDPYPSVKWTYNLPCRVPIPVQAAMSPDINIDGSIDLVKDKPTVIFVNLSDVRTVYEGPVPDDYYVNVSVSATPLGLFNPLSKTITGLAQNNMIIFYPNAPGSIGNYEITCAISYAQYLTGPWIDLDPIDGFSLVTVKDTSELALYYACLNRTGDYGTEPLAAYTNMVGNATGFINATYPVPKLTVDTAYKNLPGNQSTRGSFLGILKDCQWLAQLAKLKFPNSVAVGIGIGPNTTVGGSYKNYFAYHGATDAKGNVAVGVSFGPGTRGVVVMDGYYTAAAHELAHTFNLYYGVPEQYLTDNPGKTCNGFNAATNEWRTGYDFMGLAPYKTTGITWVNTTSTYEYLFRNTTKVKNDPEILLVNGIIYKDGTVEFPLNWYHLQQGTPDTLPPGDFALRFVASDGSILATTSFDAPFFMQIDPGIGIGENLPDVTGFGKVDTDFAGFAFATAYPQGTAVVQVINMADPENPLGAVNVANIVNVGYYFSGFLQPINNDGSSTFKLGSTIPVKFQLRDFRGSFISTAIARVEVARVANNVIGTDAEAVSTSAATKGNLFRYDPISNQYIFNLGTKSLSKGTWQIKVVLDDGTSKIVIIGLR